VSRTLPPVPLAAFKDLCLDATEPWVPARFWATALGVEASEASHHNVVLRDDRAPTIWVNAVPEPKTVKNRVHLDVYAASPGELLRLGARLLVDHGPWAVLADPEGNEFCVFPEMAGRPDGPPARVFALCLDSADPAPLAAWWASVLGGELGPAPDGARRWLQGAAGLAGITMKFVPVADERVVKNRWHWDVTTSDVKALVAAGATVLRRPDDDIEWTVLADPQGNEFCAFHRPA
jgi:Glyoxalase-like domain